jgi:hypothetical protein
MNKKKVENLFVCFALSRMKMGKARGEEKKNRLQHLLMAMSQSIRHNNNNSREIYTFI